MSRYTYKQIYAWDVGLAYFVGLMASDGCLANDKRHLILTSKDQEIIQNAQGILGISGNVRLKTGQFGTQAYDLQFSNVALYDFLFKAGITPAKSRTIAALAIPPGYYPDFLRGYFDGDGTVYGFRDNRWKNSYMYYCGFVSASPAFLRWLHSSNQRLIGVSKGSIHPNNRASTLLYAKRDSQKLFATMYRDPASPKLSRKYEAFKTFITSDPYAKIAVDARVLESVDRLA